MTVSPIRDQVWAEVTSAAEPQDGAATR